MKGHYTNKVLTELKSDGFQIRLTFIQDEMTIHITHKSGQLSKRQEEMVTKRIMDAAVRDNVAHHDRMAKKRNRR